MIIKNTKAKRTVALLILLALIFSIGMSYTTVFAEESEGITGGAIEGTTEGASNENAVHVTVILGSASSYVPQLSSAYNLLKEQGYDVDIKLYSTKAVRDYPDKVKERLSDTDVLLLEMIGQETMDSLLDMIKKDLKANGKCYITNTTAIYGESYIDYSQSDLIKQYFSNSGTENMRRLLLLLGTWSKEPLTVTEDINAIASPLPTKVGFIYHPEAKNLPFSLDKLVQKINELGTESENLKKVYNSVVKAVADITDENTKEFTMKIAENAIRYAADLTNDEWDCMIASENTDTDDEVIDIISNSKNKIADLEGVFESLDAYLAWYKACGKLNENGSWVGVATQRTWYAAEDIQMQLDLIERIEEKNGNVIFAIPPTSSSNRDKFVHQLFMKNGKSQIDVFVTVLGFNFLGTAEKSVDLFNQLGVPVIAPTQTDSLEEWEKDKYGSKVSLTTQVSLPELDGRIEPIFLGGIQEVSDAEGNLIEKRMPIDYNTDRLAGRALAWAKLGNADNSDKKVALIYYNHDGGKDGIKASYLNVSESASNILQRLQQEGYTLDEDVDLSTEGIKALIDQKGRNIGSWAPGCLDTLVEAGAMRISQEEYLKWYNELPSSMREEIEKQWGPAPGNVMVKDGEIVIPGTQIGNVFFAPQPMRGWGDDPDSITHSPILPPTHQYLAFYFWLQNEFGADAVIHLGTHGTLEWLPGRSIGQGEDDYPDQLIGNMVNIYPYIVNNPGEAVQAKRRSYGVTIGHMIPPMLQSGLYGDLQELQTLIIDYRNLISEGQNEQAEAKKKFIIEKIHSLGYADKYGESLTKDFNQAVGELHEELEGLSEELMPYGLHTIGQPLSGELLEQMVDTIVNYDKANRESDRENIKNNLLSVTSELDSIVAALNGNYIEPGPARDPIRVPEVMPTGRNLIPFDPREVPDKAAWETGKKAADDLIAAYLKEKGQYPDSVGVVLWAIETMRTRGESVAVIMRLIGVEPVYGKGGKVTEVKITPIEELGRPRIDVLVTISGLFRDTFGTTIEVLDDAFRKIAELDESEEQNKVRKNYLLLKKKLQESGISESEADSLAASRIYGSAPGSYGTGVSDLAETTSSWENKDDLTNAYMNRMSYIYGRNIFGKQATESFIENLKNVSTITQVRDSIWGTLDNDDVAQYLGGLKLAAEKYSGNSILTYIINTRAGGEAKVQSLEEFISAEIRTRILNPKWVEGMLKEGYAGSAEIGDHIKNMFLMDASTEAVNDWSWQKVAETLVFNEEIRKQLDPYIVQSIIGWNMEAARREMWKADKETLQKLADTYVQTMVDYGVVCCHHTCGNVVLNKWVAEYSTLDKEVLKKFNDVFSEATKKDLNLDIKEENKSKQKKDENKTTITEKTEMIKENPDTNETNTTSEANEDAEKSPEQNINDTNIPNKEITESATGEILKEDNVVAQNNVSAGKQPQVEPAEAAEKAQETMKKAYEISEKENSQSSSGTKAVAAAAVVITMVIVGIFLKGYLSTGLKKVFKK